MADIYHKEKWNIIPFPDSQGCLFYPSIAIMNDSICVVSGSKLSSVNILSYVNLQTGEISDLDFPFLRGEKRCVSKFGRSENI